VWVANANSDTVTEVNATTPLPLPVRVISGGQYHFDHPGGIATNGATP
jgi:hypothetical protein